MLLKTIYELTPETNIIGTTCYVRLTYQGENYYGCALYNEEDGDFFSEKVGFNIATSRAMIELLTDLYNKTKNEYNIRRRMYLEATQFGKIASNEVDPMGTFYAKVKKAKDRVKVLYEALQQEKNGLHTYIHNLETTIEQVKKLRDKDKTE